MGIFFSFSFLSFTAFLTVSFIKVSKPVDGLPLSTNSRWIVDDGSGQRVKLACVNWASHLEPVVAEGLSKRPVDDISKGILAMGFNCVRFTWPIYLATNDSLASLTVRRSFQSLGLSDAIVGIQTNNPSIIDLPLIKAFQAVVSNLVDNNVMVILDNHITKPGWCCSNSDGNGFFGDQYFDPELWIKGLTRMATLFNGVTNVIGMSLRNELRGPKQNVKDWYRYMQRGAEAVHSANPNVLVILSGLSFDTDLSFIRNQPVSLTFTGKTVFEVHWYSFTDGQAWVNGNPNQVCGQVLNRIKGSSGFLLDEGWPLFVSEWGSDLTGNNENDDRYLNCILGWLSENDLDWALWTLVGSYYLREGVAGSDEHYGVLSWNWRDIRNSSFLQRISSVQSPSRGPGLSDRTLHKVIFHPLTGLCVLRTSSSPPVRLGSCTDTEAWNYTAQKILYLKGTYYCLQSNGVGKAATLSLRCTNSNSKWEIIADSKMHLSSTADGKTVCLDVDSSNNLVTNDCKCLGTDKACVPASQWFKLVDSTRGSTTKSILGFDTITDLPGKDFLWKLFDSF
ncbi:glycosyl hydrolase 5 family protein [Mangifera indica]|uniref:glycosyl hydrolase 5 family protein n=1 Tax=Mangifera indica TaxID=29780 RepID=UPI001CF97F67|nr:glycosyl hydrolase 5 family protein [Mangifera indica]